MSVAVTATKHLILYAINSACVPGHRGLQVLSNRYLARPMLSSAVDLRRTSQPDLPGYRERLVQKRPLGRLLHLASLSRLRRRLGNQHAGDLFDGSA